MLTVLVLIGALVLGTLVVKRNQTLTAQQSHYAAAEVALGQGDYDTAISEFDAAGAYRDAPTRAQAAATTKAQQANYDAGVGGVRPGGLRRRRRCLRQGGHLPRCAATPV